MRNTILTVLLMIVLTTTAIAQNRLGFTYDEVKTEFDYERYELVEKTFKKNLYIQISQETTKTLFTFNKDSICKQVCMKPKSEPYVVDYIALFNERYEVKSYNQTWHGTDKGRNFKITLDEGNQFKFTPRK